MKRLWIVVFIILLAVGARFGWVAYQNLRGSGPAFRAPSGNIAEQIENQATNTTGFPLTLPQGFSISIYAKDLGAPRVLTWDSSGVLLTSIPSQSRVVALPDTDNDGVADRVVTVVNGLNRPHGLVFHDGQLFIAEMNQVAVYDYDGKTFQASNKKKIVDLPSGGNHVTRTIGFGPDGKLYISVGSSCNVCNEKDSRRAKILVAEPDGSNVREYATGLRNSVFFIWDGGGLMWATDMGRDLIGDDIPPDEINIVEAGRFYGWPYCYGKKTWDKQFDDSQEASERCEKSVASHVDLQAHSAPLGLAFVPTAWPKEYQGDLLVAYHGSWNRTVPTGYKIVRIKLDTKGNYDGTEDFITGWLTGDDALGRPVDVVFDKSGVLYISDDKAGVIYRVVI